MALLVPTFVVAYLAGALGLVWFDLHVLGLGDPKFGTAVDIYFPLWSAFYSPAVVAALVFLWRSRQPGLRVWRLAGLYLMLILAALEIAFVLDAGWIFLLMEFAVLGFLFWKFQTITKKIEHA